MAGWRKVLSLTALCRVLLLTTASQLYDVTTIYRFDDLEYVADPECSENEFLCGDGACIKRDVLCNRRSDCPDGSDEYNCHPTAKQCSDDQYRCNNGNCISAPAICDGNKDCASGEDEADCQNAGLCGIRQFRCNNGGCIPPTYVCDGDRDCPTGEDEERCNRGGCGRRNFMCDNGGCISTNNLCNGARDCSNGEDEMLCNHRDYSFSRTGGCKTWQFRCNFYSCINASLVCNGVNDCSNGLDEEMCVATEPSSYRVKQASVEIRARTNALGLRVATTDLVDKVSDTETNISSWPSDNETISWTAENWKLNFGPILAAQNESYFELEGEEGRLKSPAFFPNFEKICVAVESSISPDSQSSLELRGENAVSHKNFIAGVIRSSKFLEPNVLGWSRQRFLVDVPEEFQNDLIQVVLSAKKSNDAHVFVHRIYGCNVYDNEDVTVILKRYVSSKSYLSAYTVTERQFTAPEPGTTADCENEGWFSESINACQCPPGFAGNRCEKGPPKACLHGGSYDTDAGSCRCPVGFTGELCEQGCGSNRFGNDCGGICSGFLACKNMIFCRPGTNCECATGIKGDFCDSECAAGEYGAGCRETCGKCNDSPCNPYTGVCHQGCLPGFYPPFCKTTYKYLVSAPVVTSYSYDRLTVTVNLTVENIRGYGDPLFYQIQYRVQGKTEWKEQVPQNMPVHISQPSEETSYVNVTNLMGGRTYQIRAVLIDKDGESYLSDDLSSTVARTQCIVPVDVAYNLRVSNILQDGFQVDWDFALTEVSWCPVQLFEVHVRDTSRWIIHEVTAEQPQTLLITRVLPDSTFYVKVRAIRAEGAASFSPKLAVTTNMSNPGEVRNLRVVSSSSTELQLQWDRPWSPGGNSEIEYIVEYQCRRLLGCLHEECNPERGVLLVKGTSALLEDLSPLAQHYITVTATLSENGPGLSILATTNQSMAAVAPGSSTEPVSHLTNTSFVLHWAELNDCKRLNSYMYGYRYELRLANTSASDWLLEGRTEDTSATDWLLEGRTEDTSAEFTELEPLTEYEARVFLMTSAGWNKDQYLVHIVTTKATVPGPVRDLTVYKRSRRVISLRWSPPQHVYGELVSFRVSYTSSARGEQRVKSKVIPVEPCVAWPESYCHTITGLRSDTSYAVTVQARNSEVREDGESSTVTVVTREGGAPGVPVNLRLANRTQVSLTVAWELPLMLNGVLRSFVLNIEEEESYNSLECCQYFPLEEIPFTTEQKYYVKQFRDLRPSSKYRISVTGKTLSMGPSASLSAVTRPEASVLPQPPEVAVSFQHGSAVPVTLHPAVANDLLRVYLLLVVPSGQNAETHHTGLFNEDLQEQLNNAIGSAYYVAAEIVPEEFSGSMQTLIGTGKEARDETFSRTVDPVLDRGEYRIGLAAVLEFSDVYSVGFVQSHLFTIA